MPRQKQYIMVPYNGDQDREITFVDKVNNCVYFVVTRAGLITVSVVAAALAIDKFGEAIGRAIDQITKGGANGIEYITYAVATGIELLGKGTGIAIEAIGHGIGQAIEKITDGSQKTVVIAFGATCTLGAAYAIKKYIDHSYKEHTDNDIQQSHEAGSVNESRVSWDLSRTAYELGPAGDIIKLGDYTYIS